jgi:hypothetical protein
MNRKFLSFLIGVAVAVVTMLVASHGKYVPNDVFEKQYRVIKKAEYDSLVALTLKIEGDRKEDQALREIRLEDNKKGEKQIVDDIEKVSFKEYTDPQLDSLLNVLLPDTGFDPTFGN